MSESDALKWLLMLGAQAASVVVLVYVTVLVWSRRPNTPRKRL